MIVWPLGVTGLLVVSLGSQGSFQISTLFPSPILHTIPSFKISIPFRMLLQVYDIFLHGEAFNTSPSGKYLALRIEAHNES
jgi:hypothetical protein